MNSGCQPLSGGDYADCTCSCYDASTPLVPCSSLSHDIRHHRSDTYHLHDESLSLIDIYTCTDIRAPHPCHSPHTVLHRLPCKLQTYRAPTSPQAPFHTRIISHYLVRGIRVSCFGSNVLCPRAGCKRRPSCKLCSISLSCTNTTTYDDSAPRASYTVL